MEFGKVQKCAARGIFPGNSPVSLFSFYQDRAGPFLKGRESYSLSASLLASLGYKELSKT